MVGMYVSVMVAVANDVFVTVVVAVSMMAEVSTESPMGQAIGFAMIVCRFEVIRPHQYARAITTPHPRTRGSRNIENIERLDTCLLFGPRPWGVLSNIAARVLLRGSGSGVVGGGGGWRTRAGGSARSGAARGTGRGCGGCGGCGGGRGGVSIAIYTAYIQLTSGHFILALICG